LSVHSRAHAGGKSQGQFFVDPLAQPLLHGGKEPLLPLELFAARRAGAQVSMEAGPALRLEPARCGA